MKQMQKSFAKLNHLNGCSPLLLTFFFMFSVVGFSYTTLGYEVEFEGTIFQLAPFTQADKDKILNALDSLEIRVRDLVSQLDKNIPVIESTGVCDEIILAARLKMLREILIAMGAELASSKVLEFYRDDLGDGVEARSNDLPLFDPYITLGDDFTPIRKRWDNLSDVGLVGLLGHEVFHLAGDNYLSANDPFDRETLDEDTPYGPLFNAHNIDNLFDGTAEIDNWSLINFHEKQAWMDAPGEFDGLCDSFSPPTPGRSIGCFTDSLNKTIVVDSLSVIVDDTDDIITLPEAILMANARAGLDQIGFDPKVAGGTIKASGLSWLISESVVIEGAETTVDGNEFRVSGVGIEASFHFIHLTHTSTPPIPVLSGIRATPTGPASPGTKPNKICIQHSTIVDKSGVGVSNTFGDINVDSSLFRANKMGGILGSATIDVRASEFLEHDSVAVMNTAATFPALTTITGTTMRDNIGGVMVFPASTVPAGSVTSVSDSEITVTQSGISPKFTLHGIFSREADVLIDGVLISGHHLAGTAAPGAGVFVDSRTPEHTAMVRYSRILDNVKSNLDLDGSPSSNSGGPSGGGGIFSGMPLLVKKSVISGNSSKASSTGGEGRGGGGINFDGDGLLTIEDSEISHNATDHDGGGINLTSGTVFRMTNSTVTLNESEKGGSALYATAPASATLINNTIYLNNTNSSGGPLGDLAVALLGSSGSYLLANNIIYGNTNDGTSMSQDLAVTGAYSGGFNLVGGYAVGTTPNSSDLSDVDPALGSFTTTGSRTGYYRPSPGSPAVNAGDNASASSFEFDQIDATRIMGGMVDIGSIESAGPSASPPVENLTVTEALDDNFNQRLDDDEIKTAIQLWIMGAPVPGSGEVIDDVMMQSLIQLWISGESLGTTNVLASAVRPLHIQLTHQAQRFTLKVMGQGVTEMRLEVFDLSGHRVLNQTQTGGSLRFLPQSASGQRWANGIYLYAVAVQKIDGTWTRMSLKKLAVIH